MEETSNYVDSLAREIKGPMVLQMAVAQNGMISRIAVPDGWKVVEQNEERTLSAPLRKTARVVLNDVESFIAYVKRHGSIADDSTIWGLADYSSGTVKFTSILNDHGEKANAGRWRDHLATFTPAFSEEWKRWTLNSGKAMSQVEFATFIEDNVRDFATAAGMPSGAEMLQMALAFEANQDLRFKSQVRLQGGGVQLQYVADDDAQTIAKMSMFDRFALGLPVFWNGDAYQLDARLRYRVKDGKVFFWFDLIRADRVLQAAAETLVTRIKAEAGLPFFFGNPGA